ncbi:LuxR C-terminal-related transcriptional regulator [Sansalvadorimonas sp. 2012CJ34-2]|uniref:LuxR C-terminal-related transcriptional regulator n=1 Tax=Parendozoicomonas callyspongiae TaxID=2942213 RepID=A0ABT0PAY7_9GAMM|nr:LuxR C-terminal-related transcriptional regulator [Sansalvadorimonas sp. 2012CJ34-2]MCL6268548.1 LuxR C-terminal-related transcriptional regulator [Sansalvadorimonas sp. 2012CJ34-2]
MVSSVYLLTKKNLQASVLEKSLSHEFVAFTLPPSLIESNLGALSGHIVLVDKASLGCDEFTRILQHISESVEDVTVALINTKKDQDMQIISDCKVIKGVFYEDDSFETLVKGIYRMMDGEYWLSRKIMSELLEQHRKIESDQFEDMIADARLDELTPRELEILKLVSTGASNTLIADKVCLSKNTVKTHLTNLYRKLDINNRTQATIWVKENLPGSSAGVG